MRVEHRRSAVEVWHAVRFRTKTPFRQRLSSLLCVQRKYATAATGLLSPTGCVFDLSLWIPLKVELHQARHYGRAFSDRRGLEMTFPTCSSYLSITLRETKLPKQQLHYKDCNWCRCVCRRLSAFKAISTRLPFIWWASYFTGNWAVVLSSCTLAIFLVSQIAGTFD